MEKKVGAGGQPMINMVLVLGLIVVLFFASQLLQIYRYHKTKYKPHLYYGFTAFFLALAALFGIQIAAATSINNLPLARLFHRFSTMSGALGFVVLNMFAIAMTRPGEKMRGIWISFVSFLAIIFVVWAFDPRVEGVIGGTTEFTFTSMYKSPYGLPLTETILASMAVMAVYPIYLFFRVAKDTKDRIIRIKSLLIGIGVIIATTAYAIEMTDAVSYQYMPIYRPMILVGASIFFFGYEMPRKIERMLFGRAPASEEMVRSFVEEFFVHPIAPSTKAQPLSFSKALGIDHQQMVGRKILFEFDPASTYEMAIQDFANEALANAEPTVIFTRRGSSIHSSLSEQKAVKFFCLTGQVSVPKGFSENEMLLPSKDTSLILDVFDKTLKAHPEGNINVVFDSLSDLVMSIGFEKTYRFMRYTIEMLTSPRNTVLFLLNQTAHDPKVTSSLRGLFSDQISFGKEGINPIKLSKVEVGKVKT